MEPGPLITGAAGLLAGGASVVLIRKSKPEIESLTVGTLRILVEQLRTELDRKQMEIEAMRTQLTTVMKHLEDLGWPDLPITLGEVPTA